MAKSAKRCIETNDFEEAVYRYNNTYKNWKDHWWETCVTIYDNCAEWAKKYIIDPIHRIIKKINTWVRKETVCCNICNDDKDWLTWNKIEINWACEDKSNNGIQSCYLVEFLDENKNIIFSKVGTTTRKVYQRMKEECRQYTKKFPIRYCKINRVYILNKPAEVLESAFRALYGNKYPDKYLRNDRFLDTVFDLEEADKIASAYC